MIYQLSLYLKCLWPICNVLHYVSVRAVASLLSTLFFSLLFGNWFIDKSKTLFRSKVRPYTPEHHRVKDDMPTMGGIFILGMVILNMLLWCDLSQSEIWIFVGCLLGFGLIGAWDDWYKIKFQKGISAKTKFLMQVFVSILICWFLIQSTHISTVIVLPFFKNIQLDLGYFFIPWAAFIIIGTSNAVNLTDGLDGLAIGSLIPNFATFGFIAYLTGNTVMAHYLNVPFTHTAELSVIGATLVGGSLGFLWFNTYPAQIFMGDVGSLALGAGLAVMALITKQELLLAVAGGLFVLETVSVILQVFSSKWRGKRIFLMAPIHHHFELLGWPESKITVRFGIISFVLCLLALITLKLR